MFLAVILDKFSRKVVGWELGTHFDGNAFTDGRLGEGHLNSDTRRRGLVHHSDRGRSVCLWGVSGPVTKARHDSQHE